MPHLVVPQVACDEPWQPEPTHEVVLIASSVLPERVQRTPQRRNAGHVALREPRRKTVEEEVGRSWRLSSRRGAPSGRGHLTRADAAIEAAGEDRGSERFQVRLARQSGVEWLELLGCIEKQGRSVAAAPEREHDLGAQASEPRALKLVQRAPLRSRQELLRGLRRTGLELRLRCGERPATASGRIRGQLGCSLEERGRCGDAAARLRAPGRALQLVGQGLVETRSRVRAMPRAPIGIGLGIGRLGEREVHLTAVRNGCRLVDRRAHQRVTEPHKGTEVDQPGGLGGSCGVRSEPEPVGRAPQQGRVAHRLGRGRQQQSPGVVRKRLEPAQEALLDPVRKRRDVGKSESACELCRRQCPRQLEQGERVTVRLGDDAVEHRLVQASGPRRVQERAGVARAEPSQQELGQPVQLPRLAGLAHREHQADRLRQEAACDERDRQR